MEIIKRYKKRILSLNSGLPVVWNGWLDRIRDPSSIKLILCGDNPGEAERRDGIYLSPNGRCGKIAANFFAGLGLKLHEDVAVLNKTPLSTPRTSHLERHPENFELSQSIMADFALDLLKACEGNGQDTELWIMGVSKNNFKGTHPLFGRYKDVMMRERNGKSWERILCYCHFSCGRFHNELYGYAGKEKMMMPEELRRILKQIGASRKNRFFR